MAIRQVTGLAALKGALGAKPGSPSIQSVRVRFVLLNDTDNPDIFDEEGQWNAIGGIKFEPINVRDTKDLGVCPFARPLFPDQKCIPTVNEYVYVIGLANENTQDNTTDTDFYYFRPINVWNSVHHNAVPSNLVENENQKQDYDQTEAGLVRRVSDGSTEIDLGERFQENLNVRNTQPFEGDVLLEGRWGHGIRFGSTSQNSQPENPWSDAGEDGDPLMIIRNGQADDGNDPWIPQVEDINEDSTSIYLTSTQQIPIEVAADKYKSYFMQPTKPDKFDENQVILTSGRLLFNAKSDHILLSAEKSINLNTNDSVNIDAPNMVVADTKFVMLGAKDATEPVILGNKFLKEFKKLCNDLSALMQELPVTVIAPGMPNPAIAATAAPVLVQLEKCVAMTELFKSKVSFTK